jgi:hypothetical protein
MHTNPIFQSNRTSTDRIQQIVQGHSGEDLSRLTGNDWTIAVTLAHLAFWDQRVIHVLESAQKNGRLDVPYFDDQLNDILTPLLAAIPPADAAALAIRTARKLDGLLEACPADLLEQLMAINNRLVERSLHRNTHLDEIELVLVH